MTIETKFKIGDLVEVKSSSTVGYVVEIRTTILTTKETVSKINTEYVLSGHPRSSWNETILRKLNITGESK